MPNPAKAPVMLEPVPHWNKLCKEDEVLLFRAGEKIGAGRVDMRAMDGSVFWLIQSGGMGRHMVHAHDGLTVYRRPGRSG
jgi:hypothetical protein